MADEKVMAWRKEKIGVSKPLSGFAKGLKVKIEKLPSWIFEEGCLLEVERPEKTGEITAASQLKAPQ